jgi:PAS domain S-box-containing protein
MTDLRAFFDNLIAGVVIHSATGRVLDVNPMAARLMGLHPSEMVGRDVTDSWGLLDREGLPLPIDDYPVSRVLRTGVPLENMIVGVRLPPDGGLVRWLLCNAYVERSRLGEIHRVVMMLLDVSELVSARRALESSERRFRLLYENTMDAVLITRPDGSILAANPAAQKLFDASEAQIIALGREGLCDQADPRLVDVLATRAATGRAVGTFRMKRRDGTLFEAEATSVLYEDCGQVLCALVVRKPAAEAAPDDANEPT